MPVTSRNHFLPMKLLLSFYFCSDMVPDIGVDNLFSDDGEHDNLTTYNFLCGSDSNSLSPYKVKCQQKRDNRGTLFQLIRHY